MAEQTLGSKLRSLVLALLNASLILLALCLWLGWKALATAESVTDDVAEATQTVLLVRNELAALTGEIATARAEFAARSAANGEADAALMAQLSGIETQLATLNKTVAPLAADPEAMVALAVEGAFAGLGKSLADALRQVRPAVSADN